MARRTASVAARLPATLGADVVYGLSMPLWQRVRSGEGALLAIVGSVLLVGPRAGVVTSASTFACCVGVMATMYLHNDRVDADRDRRNSRKDARLSALLSSNDGLFAAIHWALAPLLTLALLRAVGGAGALFALASVLLNVAYSRWFKGKALLDVLVVGAWGGAFAAIVDRSATRVVAVALMTALSHVFQAQVDRDSDGAAGVRTTAVSSERLATVLVIAASVGLAIWAATSVGRWAATFGALPAVAYLLVRARKVGWLIAKAAFGTLWLWVLCSTPS